MAPLIKKCLLFGARSASGAVCLLCFYSLESQCWVELSDLRKDEMVSMTAGSKPSGLPFNRLHLFL